MDLLVNYPCKQGDSKVVFSERSRPCDGDRVHAVLLDSVEGSALGEKDSGGVLVLDHDAPSLVVIELTITTSPRSGAKLRLIEVVIVGVEVFQRDANVFLVRSIARLALISTMELTDMPRKFFTILYVSALS